MRFEPPQWIPRRSLVPVSILLGALLSVAPAGAQPFAFVANYLGNSVSVIELLTNQVVETIDGAGRAVDVVLTPDGRRAFAVLGGGSLLVIDTATLTTIGDGIFLEGTESIEAVASPDGSRIYVVNAISDNLSVVDAVSLELVSTIPVAAGSSPTSLAISPAGDRLYVSTFVSGSVLVIDLSGPQVVATIPVGSQPNGVTISPDGLRAYVANQGGATLTVIDTATDQVLETVAAGERPRRVVVSPDGARLYVPNLDPGALTVLDAASLEILHTIEVGPTPTDVSISPDGSLAYVAVSGADTVAVVDTASAEVASTIPVGSSPFGISNFLGCGTAGSLCLVGERFRVDVSFRTDGPFAPAASEQLTEETGYFWFFSRSNVELVVKVLDACSGYDRFWVFAGGLTDVEVEIRVTDTLTGLVRDYRNPPKTAFQPIQDTDAFATCP